LGKGGPGGISQTLDKPRSLLLALTFTVLANVASAAIPSYDKVKHDYVSTEGVLLDRNGSAIHELRVDRHGRRLPWVALHDVSPAFLNALIRAEDKRFYAHRGVDWLAMSDAAFDSLFSSKTRGASTLSRRSGLRCSAGNGSSPTASPIPAVLFRATACGWICR